MHCQLVAVSFLELIGGPLRRVVARELLQGCLLPVIVHRRINYLCPRVKCEQWKQVLDGECTEEPTNLVFEKVVRDLMRQQKRKLMLLHVCYFKRLRSYKQSLVEVHIAKYVQWIVKHADLYIGNVLLEPI